MQRRGIADFTVTRTSRTDRFAQMSRVEQVIEQKKREIQARLEKQKDSSTENSSNNLPISNKASPISCSSKNKSLSKSNDNEQVKSVSSTVNIFSNDGSFLDQFRNLSGGKNRNSMQKSKTHMLSDSSARLVDSESREKKNSDRSKFSRWSGRDKEIQSSLYVIKDNYSNKQKQSRFSDKSCFDIDPNTLPTRYPEPTQFSEDTFLINKFKSQNSMNLPSTNFPPPQLPPVMSVPPPSVQVSGPLIAPPPPALSTQLPSGICVPPPVSISASTDVSVPPPSLSTDLATIPSPNPIAVHNIPQPEPLNALNIPPPAPLQLQNIPPPSPIRLNEIPNPKPIDLLNIPAPGDNVHVTEKSSDLINAEVIKNIPPPNKSIPPPNLDRPPLKSDNDKSLNIDVSIPPPGQSVNTSVPGCLVKTSVPPPISAPIGLLPPAAIPLIRPVTPNSVIIVQTTPTIPALMAQPVLPPAGLGLCPPQTNLAVAIPPPAVSAPPPLLDRPPPQSTNQIPPMSVPPPNVLNQKSEAVCPIGSAAMRSVARMVAQCGASFEDAVRQRSPQDPNMWFLFNKQSDAYRQYREMIHEFQTELNDAERNSEYRPEDLYEADEGTESKFLMGRIKHEYEEDLENESVDCKSTFRPVQFKSAEDTSLEKSIKNESEDELKFADAESLAARKKRKRKSRWGDQTQNPDSSNLVLHPQLAIPQSSTVTKGTMLTKITRSDPALIQYAKNSFGTINLSEEDWRKAEDHYKINLLYQDMLRKRAEVDRLQKAGKFKYEYDSDEEIDGGTWEHKLRMQEMEATKLWATELTKKAEGKHHIGDFLPPEELRRFMEQSNAAKEGREPNLSDYKEYKLKADNKGFQMLQKLGWTEGQGLGVEGSGIVEPINKAPIRDVNQGLGANTATGVSDNDDEYDAYRKRMMLAYRFRPNPLNNPRRPYY